MARVIHAPAGMSRNARRQLEKMADKVDLVTASDARFFARRTDRTHRIRIMAVAEQDEVALITGGGRVPAPPGERWIAAIKQIAPGVRERRFITVLIGGDLDQPEEVCRDLFEAAGVETGGGGNMRESGTSAVKGDPA